MLPTLVAPLAAFCIIQTRKLFLTRTGGPAVRDIHLDNFSISNGGAELIENGTCTLAWGRRCALTGWMEPTEEAGLIG